MRLFRAACRHNLCLSMHPQRSSPEPQPCSWRCSNTECLCAQATERIAAREAQRAEMLRTANQPVDGLAELPADRTLLLDNVPKGSLVRKGRRRLRRKGVGWAVIGPKVAGDMSHGHGCLGVFVRTKGRDVPSANTTSRVYRCTIVAACRRTPSCPWPGGRPACLPSSSP